MTAPEDYTHVQQQLNSYPASITLPITNDTMLDLQVDHFFVVLITNDSKVDLNPIQVQIDIIDDEGMLYNSWLLVMYVGHCVRNTILHMHSDSPIIIFEGPQRVNYVHGRPHTYMCSFAVLYFCVRTISFFRDFPDVYIL